MNPALWRTNVSDKQPIILTHSNCTNKKLRFSRFRKERKLVFAVYVCDECGFAEERIIN